MKKLILLTTLAFTSITMNATSWFGWSSQEQEQIIASKEIVSQTFELKKAPTKIYAQTHAKVVIKPVEADKTPSVELRIHKNLLEHTTPQESGSTLTLGLHGNINVNSITVMEYTIYMPLENTITKLRASNHAAITIDEKVSNKNISIKTHNHGKITLSEVTAKDAIEIKTHNHGQTNIKNVTANKLTVTTANNGKVDINVDVNKLKVKTSNHARANITGKATFEKVSSSNKAKNTINVVKK